MTYESGGTMSSTLLVCTWSRRCGCSCAFLLFSTWRVLLGFVSAEDDEAGFERQMGTTSSGGEEDEVDATRNLSSASFSQEAGKSDSELHEDHEEVRTHESTLTTVRAKHPRTTTAHKISKGDTTSLVREYAVSADGDAVAEPTFSVTSNAFLATADEEDADTPVTAEDEEDLVPLSKMELQPAAGGQAPGSTAKAKAKSRAATTAAAKTQGNQLPAAAERNSPAAISARLTTHQDWLMENVADGGTTAEDAEPPKADKGETFRGKLAEMGRTTCRISSDPRWWTNKHPSHPDLHFPGAKQRLDAMLKQFKNLFTSMNRELDPVDKNGVATATATATPLDYDADTNPTARDLVLKRGGLTTTVRFRLAVLAHETQNQEIAAEDYCDALRVFESSFPEQDPDAKRSAGRAAGAGRRTKKKKQNVEYFMDDPSNYEEVFDQREPKWLNTRVPMAQDQPFTKLRNKAKFGIPGNSRPAARVYSRRDANGLPTGTPLSSSRKATGSDRASGASGPSDRLVLKSFWNLGDKFTGLSTKKPENDEGLRAMVDIVIRAQAQLEGTESTLSQVPEIVEMWSGPKGTEQVLGDLTARRGTDAVLYGWTLVMRYPKSYSPGLGSYLQPLSAVKQTATTTRYTTSHGNLARTNDKGIRTTQAGFAFVVSGMEKSAKEGQVAADEFVMARFEKRLSQSFWENVRLYGREPTPKEADLIKSQRLPFRMSLIRPVTKEILPPLIPSLRKGSDRSVKNMFPFAVPVLGLPRQRYRKLKVLTQSHNTLESLAPVVAEVSEPKTTGSATTTVASVFIKWQRNWVSSHETGGGGVEDFSERLWLLGRELSGMYEAAQRKLREQTKAAEKGYVAGASPLHTVNFPEIEELLVLPDPRRASIKKIMGEQRVKPDCFAQCTAGSLRKNRRGGGSERSARDLDDDSGCASEDEQMQCFQDTEMSVLGDYLAGYTGLVMRRVPGFDGSTFWRELLHTKFTDFSSTSVATTDLAVGPGSDSSVGDLLLSQPTLHKVERVILGHTVSVPNRQHLLTPACCDKRAVAAAPPVDCRYHPCRGATSLYSFRDHVLPTLVWRGVFVPAGRAMMTMQYLFYGRGQENEATLIHQDERPENLMLCPKPTDAGLNLVVEHFDLPSNCQPASSLICDLFESFSGMKVFNLLNLTTDPSGREDLNNYLPALGLELLQEKIFPDQVILPKNGGTGAAAGSVSAEGITCFASGDQIAKYLWAVSVAKLNERWHQRKNLKAEDKTIHGAYTYLTRELPIEDFVRVDLAAIDFGETMAVNRGGKASTKGRERVGTAMHFALQYACGPNEYVVGDSGRKRQLALCQQLYTGNRCDYFSPKIVPARAEIAHLLYLLVAPWAMQQDVFWSSVEENGQCTLFGLQPFAAFSFTTAYGDEIHIASPKKKNRREPDNVGTLQTVRQVYTAALESATEKVSPLMSQMDETKDTLDGSMNNIGIGFGAWITAMLTNVAEAISHHFRSSSMFTNMSSWRSSSGDSTTSRAASNLLDGAQAGPGAMDRNVIWEQLSTAVEQRDKIVEENAAAIRLWTEQIWDESRKGLDCKVPGPLPNGGAELAGETCLSTQIRGPLYYLNTFFSKDYGKSLTGVAETNQKESGRSTRRTSLSSR
ncbi:unnamed protein product [Amoebophrya sp. A120]|nr:unnamed protein product [Amoebophrya sp. A120]|eukprot:GSA120T00002103001.1